MNVFEYAGGFFVLERLDALFIEQADVVLETTLATRSHAPRIRRFKAAGYRIELIYLRPPSADFSVARVARRVAEGGHGIPEAALRRRFVLSLDYLETTYKPLVDAWEVYASSDDGLELLDLGTEMKMLFDRETVLKAGRDAARIAREGTREEKSGKFLPPPGWKGHLVTAADAPPAPRKKKTA
ncbi:zeta toxin family protein [Brevundimonas aurantiaca]|uniref:zeta toxin family protein n=1 Tax=Brevundimonas aurantiaca TaxID=74316 RepID=UPI0021E51A0C|nr:zeta toxin family protein [Brevundimonas aurantiaca]